MGDTGNATVPATFAPVLDSQQNVVESFVLSTNEPFWEARVEGTTLMLTGVEGTRALAVDSNETLFDGRLVVAHDRAGTLEVRVTERSCLDSRSGALYPYTGKMSFDGGDAILGCARRASDPPPGEPGNDR